ncbi:MAG: multicopper oxidase domain-containing protein, partial [Myxococcales bacterium]
MRRNLQTQVEQDRIRHVERDAAGAVDFNGAQAPAYFLPESTIYGFNGQFPGPMINVEYGRPVLVRFENDLDLNP